MIWQAVVLADTAACRGPHQHAHCNSELHPLSQGTSFSGPGPDPALNLAPCPAWRSAHVLMHWSVLGSALQFALCPELGTHAQLVAASAAACPVPSGWTQCHPAVLPWVHGEPLSWQVLLWCAQQPDRSQADLPILALHYLLALCPAECWPPAVAAAWALFGQRCADCCSLQLGPRP